LSERLRIGISSCLLGNEVRYDGRHSRSDIIIELIGELFELIPICPEVGIGLGIPRPPINLVAVDGKVHVRGVSDPEQDVTDALTDYAFSIKEQLSSVHGYIFKSRSPSCGLKDVAVYDNKTNQVLDTSAGQFAKVVMELCPRLPVADEVYLTDETLREKFIEHVIAYSKDNNKIKD